MWLRACVSLLLFFSACASTPAPPLLSRSHAFAPVPLPGPSIRLVSAPMDPVRQRSRIGKAELDQARELLSRARNDLEPRHWEALDRKLTAAERAFERFSRAARTSGQAAEVARGTEGFAQAGRVRTIAGALSRVGPLLVGLVLLYPVSTAGPESDGCPPCGDAQLDVEAQLRNVAEASLQIMAELEAQPRPARSAARESSPQKQPASTLIKEDDPRCRPFPVPHRGGNASHNECADKIPHNSFPGWDVYVNGKSFDALQLAARTLWEIKTDKFDTYTPDLRTIIIESQVEKLRYERVLALACGFDFRVGVRSPAHKDALERAAPELDGVIVVMDWC